MDKYINDNKVVITENDNIAKIEILDDCSLMYFFNEINNKLSKDKINLINMNSILSDNKISKRNLYIIKKDNKVYNISTKINSNNLEYGDYTETYISEKIFNDASTDETILKLLPDNNYSISIKTYRPEGTTKSVNIYKKHDDNNEVAAFCKLSKKLALTKVRDLLSNIDSIKDINNIISVEQVYNYLSLISEKKFSPVICDSILTLSKNSVNSYSIVLNKTSEIVGNISLTEDKEIECIINEEYQNKHISNKALTLFKNIIQYSNQNIDDSKKADKQKIYQKTDEQK